jgi:uncharacterized protein with GYD domain
MALYMYQASYTAKSMAAQLKEPQDPVEAIRPTLEDLGAKIVVAGFPFGEYDVLVVYEAPDDMTAASVAMAVAAEGEVKSAKTTRLLSGPEWLESLRKRRIITTRKARQPHDPQRQLPELLWSGNRSCQGRSCASRRSVRTISMIAATVSWRAQSRCSSTARETQDGPGGPRAGPGRASRSRPARRTHGVRPAASSRSSRARRTAEDRSRTWSLA